MPPQHWVVCAVPPTRDSVNVAQNGDIIELADGVFTGPDNRDLDHVGKAITIRLQSDDSARCTINCQNIGHGFRFASGEGLSSVLRGIRVLNALSSEDGRSLCNGGGVHCSDFSSPTIQNCVFESNAARPGDGGEGLYCKESAPMVVDCDFISCSAKDGGALFADTGSRPYVQRCTFQSNWVGQHGGGAYCNVSSRALFDACEFTGNSARYGAGVCVASAATSFSSAHCAFVENAAGIEGGGPHCGLGYASITYCTFRGNPAPAGGARLPEARPPSTAATSTAIRTVLETSVTSS
jgi:hypothetical protein